MRERRRIVQRSLFEDDEPAASRPAVSPVAVAPEAADLALHLPREIRLGTSSWSFPGWTGIVYAARDGRPPGEPLLARHGLAAYASQPLFRTVSLDRTFYAPLKAAEFAAYAAQVPSDFRFVVKAPAAVTDPFSRAAGAVQGDNPCFLDAGVAAGTFVAPAVAGLGPKAGPLVFQFPPLGRTLLADLPRTAGRIAAFMAAVRSHAVARGAVLAAEVRDPELASAAFAAALADAGCIPCLAIHARMPPVERQAAALGLDRTDDDRPLVARWNLHAGRTYAAARTDYFPFDRLVEEDPATRAGLARLARAAAAGGREVFITINNKAEGSAPLSVARLAAACRGE